MLRILHCADLHLDSPLAALDLRRAEVRRNELRAALTSLTLSAKMNAVDFLLISGDLFDGALVSRDTIDLLCREFAAIPDCRVIIAPGNHDPYTHSSHYRRAVFPENVYIFDSPELACFDFPDKNVTVYGWAFTSDAMTDSPLAGFSVEDPARINILCAHADLDAPGSRYCPISSAELAACGFDFAALGHRHAHDGVNPCGGGYVAYAGCLEGRGFDECGIKGAVLIGAEKSGALKLGAKLVRCCKRHYEIEAVDVTGAVSNADVIARIGEMLAEKHYGDDVMLRVKLVGELSPECRLASEFIASQFPQIFYMELLDETKPAADVSRLADDPTLRGAFYRSLADKLASEDADERETAARALRCGLAALAGEDITDI